MKHLLKTKNEKVVNYYDTLKIDGIENGKLHVNNKNNKYSINNE